MSTVGEIVLIAVVILIVIVSIVTVAVDMERDKICRTCGFDGLREGSCYVVDPGSGIVTLYPMEEALRLCEVER